MELTEPLFCQMPESELLLLPLVRDRRSLMRGESMEEVAFQISGAGDELPDDAPRAPDPRRGLPHREGPAVTERRGGPKPSGASKFALEEGESGLAGAASRGESVAKALRGCMGPPVLLLTTAGLGGILPW